MRIWVDGCFDFFHHGHAGALNQARALGDELIVGIHTDEEILKNKGPVVMRLDERELAVVACRWTTEAVSGAPYVTDANFMMKYGCEYVAHGDDITTDADGNDCYQALKDADRFLEFKRTPNISTTDLIDRMLNRTTKHHEEAQHSFLKDQDAQHRFEMYAKAADAKSPYAGVWHYGADRQLENFVKPAWKSTAKRIVYVEGAFDLFHCGHIEFLKFVREHANKDEDLVIVGLRSDKGINRLLGNGSPIMNIFERALCVLQCRYIDGVILNVPYKSTTDGADFIANLHSELGLPIESIAYGCKEINPADGLYECAQTSGNLLKIPEGKYGNIRTSTIVDRVLANRIQYEQRQRKKGVKSANEREMEARERESRKSA